MTEPCHCDLTTENAKLRAEVERLKREATSARSAIRHAIQLIEGPGGNRKECLADLRAVLAYEPRAALKDQEVICRFMEPKPNLANGDCVGLPEQFWRRRLGTVDEVEPMPLTLDRLREVEARLTEEQWEAYDQKIKALASVLREAANG